MTSFLRTYAKALIAVAIAAFFGLWILHASATEPSPQERASAELPSVLREIDKTQEYADRNAAAKARRQVILSCVNTGDCEGF